MTSANRKRILDAVTTKTKVVALTTLIIETLFLSGVGFLPDEHRIYAFGICASLILVALVGIFYIESLGAKGDKTPDFSTERLPKELKHRAIILTRAHFIT
jgi:hypothetical protein